MKRFSLLWPSAPSPSRPPARLLAYGVAAALSLAACKKPVVDNPLLAPPVVEVAEVSTGDVPIVREWIGSIDGSNNAQIRARVSGYILAQKYVDGAQVKKGDLLFEIDPRPFEASLAQAQASLAQAQADQLKAQLNADKYTKAYEAKAVSEQDRDNAVQQNEAAKAQVKAQEAAVEQAALNLQFTKITAPLDGIASIASRNVGDLVGPGDPTGMATLSTVDPIRVYFQVSEQTYLHAAGRFSGKRELEGLPVRMVLANGQVYPHDGTFVAVDRDVQGSTGTIRVAAAFPNPGGILRPGQFARVRVVVALEKDALLIPQQAVEELQGSFQVAVLNADDTASIRVIKPGPRHGAYWVVEEGLKAGEKVIVEGGQKVGQGKKVVPKPYTPPAETPAAAAPAEASAGAPAAPVAPAAPAAE